MTELKKRLVTTHENQKTTVALEPEFWESIDQIAQEQGRDSEELVTEVCEEEGNRARNLRLFVLEHFKMKLSKVARKR